LFEQRERTGLKLDEENRQFRLADDHHRYYGVEFKLKTKIIKHHRNRLMPVRFLFFDRTLTHIQLTTRIRGVQLIL
jgi:hypothetical protein